jgi:DNA polymerase-4
MVPGQAMRRMEMEGICRDCLTNFATAAGTRCPACRSPRIRVHPEFGRLAVAHLDADAFYAAVEKRDDSGLRDLPVIVGGGRRGVVTTACYIARLYGVRSAMPMFKALRLCPEAVVIRPRMAHYAAVSREIRARLERLTPLVEPVSLDEAFLDLSGTDRLHGAAPAVMLARLQAEIERDLGLTVSVGLSHARYLAKIASDLDKPRGFTLIGRAETLDVLAPLPLARLPGIGPVTAEALARDGLRTVAEARARGRDALIRRQGDLGLRLHRLAHGEDVRAIAPGRGAKSISNETTFAEDIGEAGRLRRFLWLLAEKVSARAKEKGLAGYTVTVKLKQADHRVLTRRHTLPAPVQLADTLYRQALPLLERDLDRAPFRLIGVGIADLVPATGDGTGDLADPGAARRMAAERAADRIRARFGADAIRLGRGIG